jgi:hypothetical protein
MGSLNRKQKLFIRRWLMLKQYSRHSALLRDKS